MSGFSSNTPHNEQLTKCLCPPCLYPVCSHHSFSSSLLPTGYLGGNKTNDQGVANRGHTLVSSDDLLAANPGFELTLQLLCGGNPALASTPAAFIKTFQSIERLQQSESADDRQQGQQQLIDLVGGEELEKLVGGVLAWLTPNFVQRTQSQLLAQFDAVVVRVLALRLSAAGCSPFAAGSQIGLWHKTAEVKMDVPAWQQQQQDKTTQHHSFFCSSLSGVSDVGVGSSESLLAAVLISLRKNMANRSIEMPRAAAGSRQGGWVVEDWNEGSGIVLKMVKDEFTGDTLIRFPGYPSRSNSNSCRRGTQLLITTIKDGSQQLHEDTRDLGVEAGVGIGRALCPRNRGRFPLRHVLGFRCWLEKAAALGSLAGADGVFEVVEQNPDLWPPQWEDGQLLTADEKEELYLEVQREYKLRDAAASSSKRFKKDL